ncbi:MAG: ATPase, T2SS/T4P/T4SS family [Lentisphaeria bacterium]|nr:ATPase, T2SS/T4P/T4SS family [Lentisphaeria bacterium]
MKTALSTLNMDLAKLLIESGAVTAEQYDQALEISRRGGRSVLAELVSMGIGEELDFLRLIGAAQSLEVVDLRRAAIAPEAVEEVPAKFARHYGVMPVALSSAGLTIAVSESTDRWVVDDLQTTLGHRVQRVLAPHTHIQEAIERHYGVGADTIERIMDDEQSAGRIQLLHHDGSAVQDLERMAGDASVVRLVNEIVQQAISDRATDIHLETFGDEAKLRCRVDGVLRDTRVSEDIRYLYPAVISRIKIMSGLDIIERRVPQDGRAKVKDGPLEYDLRVSVMPTINGENVVIRILPTTMLLSLGDLGLRPDDLRILDGLIHRPNGILFVTGPTGSGKSTTLYASLKRLNNPGIKLVTIEDPVEYALRGVSQVQVNTRTGMTFARALRSMLRHDPDVIMVGEIRDLETATIATRAALTGHLVLSTLHTNSASAGAARLIDIGIEPYLIASSVLAFIGQRLIRVNCPKCKESCRLDDETLALLGHPEAAATTVWRGKGCDACGQTGFSGRTGIYEILPVDGRIRHMIVEKASADTIKDAARARGARSMLEDGWEKIVAGRTTPEEVLRVARLED